VLQHEACHHVTAAALPLIPGRTVALPTSLACHVQLLMVMVPCRASYRMALLRTLAGGSPLAASGVLCDAPHWQPLVCCVMLPTGSLWCAV
jgi:hypothetical protein